jgi:hypothetical protein
MRRGRAYSDFMSFVSAAQLLLRPVLMATSSLAPTVGWHFLFERAKGTNVSVLVSIPPDLKGCTTYFVFRFLFSLCILLYTSYIQV